MAATPNGFPRDRPGAPANSAKTAVVDPDAVRQQLERVAADRLFRHSKRYSDLLRYIVDRTLEGHQDELKERIIGIEVFGRRPDYDTSLDPTVRVAAGEVRKRLALYYKETIHKEELLIEVPVRAYLAKFHVTERRNVPLENVPPQQPPAPKKRTPAYWKVGAPVVVILILALSVWGIQRLLFPVPAIDKYWAPVLKSSGPVLIYIGSPPDGLSIPRQEPVPPGFANPGMPLYEFALQRGNVPMADVNAANALSAFFRQRGKDSVVSRAHNASFSDLRSSPAVLLGSFDNRWATRLGADLRYRILMESYYGVRWVEDKNDPANKKWSLNLSAPYEQVDSDYALISRVFDQSTGQWWIGIAGFTGSATLTANQLVLDRKRIESVAAKFPKDWEHKNLQIVLAIKMVQGSPGGSQVVAVYSW